jgi:hypothetical protein
MTQVESRRRYRVAMRSLADVGDSCFGTQGGKLVGAVRSRLSSEEQFDRELCRPRAANGVQCVLPVWETPSIEVRSRARTYFAET